MSHFENINNFRRVIEFHDLPWEFLNYNIVYTWNYTKCTNMCAPDSNKTGRFNWPRHVVSVRAPSTGQDVSHQCDQQTLSDTDTEHEEAG